MIPAGWDTIEKINLINSNFQSESYLNQCRHEDTAISSIMISDYKSYLPNPPNEQTVSPVLDLPENEQKFLTSHHGLLIDERDDKIKLSKSHHIENFKNQKDDVSVKIAKLLVSYIINLGKVKFHSRKV
jgi:hypothetical protein